MITINGFSLEDGYEGKAFVRLGLPTLKFLRVLCSSKFQTGSHQVNNMTALLGDATGLGLQSCRPMDDSWSTSSSVMNIGLVTAHGSILGVRPVMSNASVGHGSAHWDIVFVAHCDRLTGFLGLGQYVIGRVPSVSTEVFGACSVIVKIDDECILHSLRFLKGFEECSHCLIHVINHCCIDCHVTDAPRLVVYRIPRLDPVFRQGKGPVLLVDDSHLEHAGISFIAQFLPSTLIGFDVLLYGFLGGMDGPMCGGESDILKKWFI